MLWQLLPSLTIYYQEEYDPFGLLAMVYIISISFQNALAAFFFIFQLVKMYSWLVSQPVGDLVYNILLLLLIFSCTTFKKMKYLVVLLFFLSAQIHKIQDLSVHAACK